MESAKGQDAPNIPELLTIEELAALLKISPRTIWRLIKSGELVPPLHIGGSIRWRKDSIARWLDRGCADSDNGMPQ